VDVPEHRHGKQVARLDRVVALAGEQHLFGDLAEALRIACGHMAQQHGPFRRCALEVAQAGGVGQRGQDFTPFGRRQVGQHARHEARGPQRGVSWRRVGAGVEEFRALAAEVTRQVGRDGKCVRPARRAGQLAAATALSGKGLICKPLTYRDQWLNTTPKFISDLPCLCLCHLLSKRGSRA